MANIRQAQLADRFERRLQLYAAALKACCPPSVQLERQHRRLKAFGSSCNKSALLNRVGEELLAFERLLLEDDGGKAWLEFLQDGRAAERAASERGLKPEAEEFSLLRSALESLSTQSRAKKLEMREGAADLLEIYLEYHHASQ